MFESKTVEMIRESVDRPTENLLRFKAGIKKSIVQRCLLAQVLSHWSWPLPSLAPPRVRCLEASRTYGLDLKNKAADFPSKPDIG